MSIIDSIESTFNGITMRINNTDFWARLKGGQIKSIIYIYKVPEMYKENLDIRILSFKLKRVVDVKSALELPVMLCFEFMDKHVYCQFKDKIIESDEYTFIDKGKMIEIKGGKYNIDKLAETFSKTLSGGNNV